MDLVLPASATMLLLGLDWHCTPCFHPTLSSFCTGQTCLSHCSLGTTTGNRLRITRLQNCQEQYYGSTPDDCTNPMAICDDGGNVVDLNCSGQDTEGPYMEPYSQLLCREVWSCPTDVLACFPT